MNVFPVSNLPVQTQTWGREVEKRLNNLDSAFRSAEINNVTRDSQMISNYRRLDATVTQLAATTLAANEAQNKSIEALQKADEAIADIIDLGTPGGPTINAGNITTGSLSADRISGGTIDASDIVGVNITGANILTASSGTRVDLSGSNIEFFSASYGGGGPRVGYIQGDDGGVPGLYVISDQGAIALDAVDITLSGDATVTGELQVNGSLGVTGSFSPGSISTGSISGTSITGSSLAVGTSQVNPTSIYAQAVTGDSVGGGNANFTGTVSATTLSGGSVSNSGNYTGNGFPTIRDNTVSGTTTFAPNVFISASTGNMARNTTMSERRAKENIQELEFNSDAFISINPVTFNYKREAVSDDEQAQAVNLGFILDDFEDAGLGDFLVAEPFEGDEYKQLRYNLLYMYLHKVVQEQNQTIKDMTARIAALESKVQ